MKIYIYGNQIDKKLETEQNMFASKKEENNLDENTPEKHKDKILSITPTIDSKKNFQFKIIPHAHSFQQIIPNINTKNDKINLFVDSFSGGYKEFYRQIQEITIDNHGIQLPEQDKIFFETLIENKSFKQFIISLEKLREYVNQQISFTWHHSTLKEIEDPLESINFNHSIGYEIRFKYTSGLSLKIDGRIQEKPLREFLELARVLKDDEKVYMQFGFQPAENEWHKLAKKHLNDFPKNLKISEQSKSKLGFSGFDCCLRLIIQGSDENRNKQIARGFILALKQLDGDNELIAKPVKNKEKWISKYVKQRKIPSSLKFNKRMVMTWKEISHFIKLPQRHLQLDFNLQTIDRVETEIPKILQRENGILIGHATRNGKKIAITIPKNNLDDLMKSYVFTGSPRVGKDTTQINLIVEAAKHGCGAIVPDVIDERGNDRGMADSIRDAINQDQLIDINLCDYNYPVYFGLEDVMSLLGENGINIMANNLVKLLGLNEHASTQRLCRLVAKACKCNIYEMANFIRSDYYAKKIYEKVKEEDELLALQIEHEYFQDSKNQQAKNALYTRLDEILGNDHFKHMVGQEPINKLDFEKWIRERKIVLLRMRKMDIGELGIQILMYLLVFRVFWIKKIIETDDPTFLVLNEPHQFMSPELDELISHMLVESPKYRLSMLIAFHYPSPQFISKNLYDAIRASSINWFLFKNTNISMYQSIREQLDPITIEAAMKTERYESIFLPYVDGKQQTPFFMKMLPPPSKRMKMFDNQCVTKSCTQTYGTPLKKVKERIKRIEIDMYKNK